MQDHLDQFCEGIGRSCRKLCLPLHTVLVAQVIYSTVVVRNYLRHDLYSPNIILATVVNPNLVSVVPGLLAAVLFLEVMIGMGHSST